ncbi:MAG: flagellar basal body rod protein FlgB [Planctomycetota bacterium]|nr:flagellar basal body rod protein FlgB [Planctomycetota bacterium]
MISELANAGAMPSLELTLRFAAQRQRILAHNIANVNTPNFRPLDVSVTGFQRELREAIEQRRARSGGEQGRLELRQTQELRTDGGGLTLNPTTPADNILFHDRNNRDLERMMQDLAENAMAFRVASDLLKSRQELLRTAISQRV